MNELINISVRIENENMVTDSRNVSDVFRKRHDHVLRDIQNIKKDAPNFGEMFYEGTMPDSYGREQKVYLMNRDGFTLLAMGFTGKDAMQWKLKYIEAFNQLERAWNSPEQVMARALKLADQTIAGLEQKVLEMKPKAEFYDQVTDSKDAIDMKDCANVLHMGIGRNKLFKFLRDQKILTESNRPYQEFVDRGYFRTVEQKFDRGYGEVGINVKTLVFQKGVDYIRKRLAENGYKLVEVKSN